jgi:chemotaxis protein methyltransferase CheR
VPREILIYFAKYIETELGIVYSEFNYYQLQNRIEEIVRILGLKDVTTFYLAAKSGISPQVKQLLLDTATNNETSFFRDPKVFKALQDDLLPDFVKRFKTHPYKKLRVWSAACSSGQETYTLSMVFKDFFANHCASMSFDIVATDISSKILERARTGKYSQLEIQRGLPASLMTKYFEKNAEDQWLAKAELKKTIQFQPLNLLESYQSLGKFDLIFCRNVLIYQSVENKIAIISRLAECLEPGGILAMGAGESLIGLSERYETIKWGDCLFYRVKAKAHTLVA